MAEFGELIVVYDLLPEMAERLKKAADEAVRKAAFDIAAHAMAEAGTFRQTGFLTNSIYVKPHGGGENPFPYSNVQEPQGDQQLLPEVEEPKEGHAIVAVGANYGLYVEYGTVHMSAHPYLTPAAELLTPYFLEAMHHLETAMRTGQTVGE